MGQHSEPEYSKGTHLDINNSMTFCDATQPTLPNTALKAR